MIDIQSLSLDEGKKVLKNLRSFADVSKKVGKRGKKIFEKQLSGHSQYVVEFFPGVSEDFLYQQASDVYKKLFGVQPEKEEIQFIEKESILGGMKVYMNDYLVDLSYSRVVGKLKI